MAHRGQELNARLLLQTDDPPPIGSSTEQGITKASGSRSRLNGAQELKESRQDGIPEMLNWTDESMLMAESGLRSKKEG